MILDTSGGGLSHVTSGVYLLKPSVRELRECMGRALSTEGDQVAAARELVQRGLAHAVVVSLGPDGALLVTDDDSHRFPALPVQVVSGVGAGDAMVAGITVALSRGWSLTEAVRYGIAASAAKLLTPGTACFAAAWTGPRTRHCCLTRRPRRKRGAGLARPLGTFSDHTSTCPRMTQCGIR